MDQKKKLWLFLGEESRFETALAVPTAAWMAKRSGADFECYLESRRDGRLFARTGSTVLGGRHFEQFNYLFAHWEVACILFGSPSVFRSSLKAFHTPVLAETDDLHVLYQTLLNTAGIGEEPSLLLCPNEPIEQVTGKQLELLPYLFPDIYYHERLAYPVGQAPASRGEPPLTAFLSDPPPGARALEEILPEDDYGTVSLRIARRNLGFAKGVCFADPPAVLFQLATLCREERVAVYGEAVRLPQKEVVFHGYTEAVSSIHAETAQLCRELHNPVLLGRQTGDGDLFAWGKQGICMQIMDPNRPAFPIVAAADHSWARGEKGIFDLEPDDAQLERWAREGKILAGLIFHSGEMAHNEAMLNLMEFCSITGLKLGIGTHAARYRTCPQAWELLRVPPEQGGVLGQVEPVLHSGGLGIMAERGCPPELLKRHCIRALREIEEIAGKENLPRGYYAFADTDLETLREIDPELFAAAEGAGLEYFISSARPGRNLALYEGEKLLAVNQTVRTQCYGSPFVRISSVEDLQECCSKISPGWILAALDSPVVSFSPYIWSKGNRFTEIADYLLHGENIINATPHTISRYARILRKQGIVPGPETK